ncbi:MAG: transporter substrate-binding protein [Clostridia bacterium]|jgi:zinc transport system substrate-binding protein|nr:transporter substrate-binding protein [Clostridia bacterium]
MKKLVSIMMVAVLIMGLAACSRTTEKPAEQSGLTIYTSFYPMQFLATRIAGDKAQVISLVPAGVEPHDWEPKPKTLAGLQESDMLIYNGAGMEAWLEDFLPSLQKAGVKTVNTSTGLELIPFDEKNEEEDHEGEDLAYDPHVWVSPAKYKQQAQSVLNALIEVDGANQEYYNSNYNMLAEELDKLDGDYRQAVAGFKSKVFIVSHSAFEYLAKDYGLTQLPIRGVTPQAEPSPAKLAELVQICRENNIKYIFFESLVSPKLSETLANEVGAETLVLNDGQGITEDQIKQGRNYITIMYENLENLKKALSDNE